MISSLRRLLWLTRRRRKEAELREELQFHLDEETGERESAGLTPEAAKAAAHRDLGNVAVVQEETRDAWGWVSFGNLIQDLRFGVRVLRKSPDIRLWLCCRWR